MSVCTDILRSLADAGGAVDTSELTHDSVCWRKRLSELKSRGLVVSEYRITDEGREYLAGQHQAPRRAVRRAARALAALDAAWRQPARTAGPCLTDEQIESIKRKAQEDRALMQDTTPPERRHVA
jgi:DNA-binding PadR family transcriptional regulator